MSLSRRSFMGGAAAALLMPWPKAANASATFGADALRADFDDLMDRLERSHFDLYVNRSRRAYRAEHARLRRLLRPDTSNDDALRIFQRLVAYGRVAHARIDAASVAFRAYRTRGGRIFPLTLRIKDGRAFVMANASGDARISAGDELLAIEGRPAMAMLDSLWPDVSADTRYMFHSMLEWELPRLLWQRLGPRQSLRLALGTQAGGVRRLAVAALGSQEIAAAELSPAPLTIPPDERSYRVIGGDVAFLRPGPFYAVEEPERPYDNRAFCAFIDRAFRDFLQQGISRLIIDLRDNPGGDRSFSDHMISWFATRPFRFASSFRIKVSEAAVASNQARLAVAGNDPTGASAGLARAYAGARNGDLIDLPVLPAEPRSGDTFAGKVFVLINRHSYSNAVNVAALIQDYGFGTILGEETSDLATTLGAMEQFTLARTGIVVGFPKARIVRPNGDLAQRGVIPDAAIDFPVVETQDDPVLQRALTLARNART